MSIFNKVRDIFTSKPLFVDNTVNINKTKELEQEQTNLDDAFNDVKKNTSTISNATKKPFFSDVITYEAPEKDATKKAELSKPKGEKDTALTAGQFGPEITEFQIKDRPVKIQVDEMDELGGVLFGEANNDIEEMRIIANIVINRANESNKTILQELTKRTKNGGFEFNAYAGNQYNKYRAGDFDFVSQTKADKVQQVMKEIQDGTLVDNTDGAIYFSHDTSGNIGTTTDLYENIRHANK